MSLELLSTRAPGWSPAPTTRRLVDSQVHVWRASLDLPTPRVSALQDHLAEEEQRRAERFRFDTDRRRFIAARGQLRAILASYLGVGPSRVRFDYGLHGKPELCGGRSAVPLRFNLSHSDGVALYAVTRGRELGIDLETTRHALADGEIVEIAERFFSRREVVSLCALSAHLRREAFFACWTRKEAFIKATGKGVTLDLKQFDVSLAPGERPALLSIEGSSEAAARWSLCVLSPGESYAAALAVEGQGWELKTWQWTE